MAKADAIWSRTKARIIIPSGAGSGARKKAKKIRGMRLKTQNLG
tara:strand:+ start:737 stop:868 length:132 start_codon:yes stop_codon:yes gene_type:complete